MLADTPGVKWVRDALDGRFAADHGHYFCGELVKAPGTVVIGRSPGRRLIGGFRL